MSFGLGLGLGLVRSGGPLTLLRNLLNRPDVAVAGRGRAQDGTAVCTRATEATSVFTGALLSANVADVGAISAGPGLSLPAYMVSGQRTNLVFRSDAFNVNWGLANLAIASGTRFDGTTGNVLLTRTSTSLSGYMETAVSNATAGNTLVARAKFKSNGVGSNAGLRISGSYPNRCDAVINLTTGAVVSSGVGGNWTGVVASSRIFPGGWVELTVSGVPTNASETATVVCGPTNNSGSAWEGSSGTLDSCFVSQLQCEQATFPSRYIPTVGSAVTHNADQIVWTPTTPFPASAAGELVRICAPYLWAANSAGRVIGLNRTAGTTSWLAESYVAGSNRVITYGLTGNSLTDGSPLNSASGNLRMHATLYNGTTIVNVIDGLTDGAPAATTLTSLSSLDLLSEISAGIPNREFYGIGAFFFVPGGLSTAERSALQTLRQKSVAYGS